jgi:peptidoglycan/LPS O-acetylase OafA/YrhL
MESVILKIAIFLSSNRRQVNLFRLFLAGGVLVSHSYVLGGFGSEPVINLSSRDYTLGSICVAFFFMLSGFLIHESAATKSFSVFWKSRFFRIFPGYFAVLAVTSFILAPALFLYKNQTLDLFWVPYSSGPISYFIHNIVLPTRLQSGIREIFLQNPFGLATGIDSLNGPLWTLPLEIRCYFVIFLLSRLIPKKISHKVFSFLTFSLFIFLNFSKKLGFSLSQEIEWSLCLVLFFLFGSLVSKYHLNTRTFSIIAFLAFSLGFVLPLELQILLTLPLVFAVFLGVFALIPDVAMRRYSADLSFGFYIWSWPVTQTTIFLFPSHFNHSIFILLIGFQTFILSAISWFTIERRFILRK